MSDFFEGNSTSKTSTKFDDHQTSHSLGLRIFWMVSPKVSDFFVRNLYPTLYEFLVSRPEQDRKLLPHLLALVNELLHERTLNIGNQYGI